MARDYVKSAVRLHRAEPAERVLTAAVEHAPSASLLVARALLYWNTNRPDLALQSLQSASGLDPKEVSAYLLGAEIQSAAGNLQAMRELVARALAVNAQNPEAIGLAAEAELKDGRLEPASRLAAGALGLDSTESRALEVQALALAQLGRPQEARSSFLRLLAAAPDAAASRNNFGVFELQQGNAAAAARLFKDAVDLDPSDLNGYRGLKEAAVLLNRTDLIQFADRGLARRSR
jgi:Tfp pilus assembly protein PilF